MKKLKYLITALVMMITCYSFAQGNTEDVIYLKNGSVYRGTIIEQVPNVSYKIQIAGGSIFTVTVAEIEKITKEEKYDKTEKNYDGYGMGMGMHHFPFHKGDSTAKRTPYYARKRRFYTELEFRPGLNNVSLRLTHGFKFGRFGFIGLGIGADAVSFSRGFSTGKGIFDNTNADNGLYLPLYLKYQGEILKKRITPYYYVEAGYAAHPNNPFTGSNGNKSWGGPTAAAGFGVRFYSRNRASVALNANVTWRTNRSRSTFTSTDVFGNPYTYTTNNFNSRLFGSLGLSIGF